MPAINNNSGAFAQDQFYPQWPIFDYASIGVVPTPTVITPISPNPGQLRMLWSNLVDRDGTSLTASSQPISVNNIKNQHRKRIWRTASPLNQTLIVDLQNSADDVRCCALTGYNFTATATVTLAYSDDAVVWTSISGKTVGDGNCLFFFFTLVNRRYWKLTLNDASSTDGYLELGRVFLGDYWEPNVSVLRGWSLKFLDRSDVKKSIGLQKWTNQREIVTQLTFQLPHLNETDAVKNFLNIARRIGVKQDFFITLLPGASELYQMETGLYGRFSGVPGLVGSSSFAYDTGTIVFEESF